MSPELYFGIGIPFAVVTLLVGAFLVGKLANEPEDMVFGSFFALCGVFLAFTAWPAIPVVLVIGLIAVLASGKLKVTRDPKPDAETDHDRYKRMAREQRDLAKASRRNGWDDTSRMQDDLAAQYEHLADMYRTTT